MLMSWLLSARHRATWATSSNTSESLRRYTVLRTGELCGLRWREFDLKRPPQPAASRIPGHADLKVTFGLRQPCLQFQRPRDKFLILSNIKYKK